MPPEAEYMDAIFSACLCNPALSLRLLLDYKILTEWLGYSFSVFCYFECNVRASKWISGFKKDIISLHFQLLLNESASVSKKETSFQVTIA